MGHFPENPHISNFEFKRKVLWKYVNLALNMQ